MNRSIRIKAAATSKDFGFFAIRAIVVVLIALVAIGLWKTGGDLGHERLILKRRPQAVMGTTCSLAVVTQGSQQTDAETALRQAEAAIRQIEARMSCWLADSEISKLARTPVGRLCKLSPDTLEVLRAARAAHEQTGGGFDVTCRPLIQLWRAAVAKGRPPREDELAAARSDSSWALFELSDAGAVRLGPKAAVDLGGIAKGEAIDRAAAVLKAAGMQGGMVDIGGDLACFGQPPKGHCWLVDIQNPFDASVLAKLQIVEGAVCTSGDYARPLIIAGRRYSHIINPAERRPTNALPSVTVVAPRARDADIWATALSALGPQGFERLPADVEAMIVVGSKDDYGILATKGMHEMLQRPMPKRITVWR